MCTHYPDEVQNLLKAYAEFRSGGMKLGALKSAIWRAASVIVSVEEADFREFLQWAEGAIDVTEFTTENVYQEALKIVERIETEAKRRLVGNQERSEFP